MRHSGFFDLEEQSDRFFPTVPGIWGQPACGLVCIDTYDFSLASNFNKAVIDIIQIFQPSQTQTRTLLIVDPPLFFHPPSFPSILPHTTNLLSVTTNTTAQFDLRSIWLPYLPLAMAAPSTYAHRTWSGYPAPPTARTFPHSS